MKANVTMKALSAAVLGLAGMAFAGSALADCPAGSNDPGANWPGGRATTGGGVLGLEAPGLKANETRYRFRFYLDTDLITPFTGLQQVQLFTANAANPFPAAGGSLAMVRAVLVPGGTTGRRVGFLVGTNDPVNSYIAPAAFAPINAGANYIEGELIVGAAGTGKFNYWVNNNVAGTPTGTVNVDNAGWVGVDTASLGMANGNSTFRTLQQGKKIYFDEFDSRRQTFIGQ